MRKYIFLFITLFFMMLSGCVGDVITITSEEIINPGGDEPGLIDPGLKWSLSEVGAVMGQENNFPTLTNIYRLKVDYASSVPDVATIDSDGAVTLVGAGVTVISASYPADGKYEESRVSYTLTVTRAAAGLSWDVAEATAVMLGENSFPVLSNPNGLEVTFTSSDETVATVAATEGGCAVSLVGAGVTTITASSAESAVHDAASVSYTLTVSRAARELAWSTDEATAVLGENNYYPTLINPDGFDVTFVSSNEGVATVTATADGYAINLLSAGVTTITAFCEQNGTYEAVSASYTLTVSKSAIVISWSDESCTVTLGDEGNIFPKLSNPGSQEISYSSSNENVATVEATVTGYAVTLLDEGTTTIIATSVETEIYTSSSAHFTLNVLKPEIPDIPSLTDPELSWSKSYFFIQLGSQSGDYPSLNNPHNVPVTYKSSNPAVAAVNPDGTVTLLSGGSTVITAASEADGTYSAGSASYTLYVQLLSAELSWTTDRCSATIGSSYNSFPTLVNEYGLTVSYTSSDTSVAAIDDEGRVSLVGKGTTVITATSEETDLYYSLSTSYTLTVNLADPSLSWSADSYTTTLFPGSNSFPVLSNIHDLPITYSSSDTDVAEIDDDGTVTPVGLGTTVITATSEETSRYRASSSSYTLRVVKNTVSIAWSAGNFTAILENGDANTYPFLSVAPSGLEISYSSSNTDVATIDGNGHITLAGTGNTYITASFEGDQYYEPGSATYKLSVIHDNYGGEDDGAVETTFPSAGESASDDDISNTHFTRLITVTFASGGATVTGYAAVAAQFDVSVDGNEVIIDYSGSENVVYKLTGSTTNGFFRLYSSKKQAIWLDGVSINCNSGAAIDNQSGKRTFIYVDGYNDLSDGASASYSSSDDMKGVLFSEGQLLFSGSGSLFVTASNSKGKSGIVSDDYVKFMASPSVTVSAGSGAGHGVKANDYVVIRGGSLDITTSADMKKGIKSDGYVIVSGGSTNISVSGGVGLEDREYKGSAGIKADDYFEMSAGNLTIYNSGSGGKGINAGDYEFSSDHSVNTSSISGGNLTITTTGSELNDVSSKGIKVGWSTKRGNTVTGHAGDLTISGGKVYVECAGSEAIEAKGDLTVNGGQIYATSSADDAINCQGEMDINGGYIYAYSSRNDALDSNEDMKVNGGYVYAVTTRGNPEVALDANTEGGYKLYIYSGATIVAYGGLERGYSSSQNIYTFSATANSWNGLYNGSKPIAAFKGTSGITSYIVTAPSLSKGFSGVSVSTGSQTCFGTWATGGISGGTETSLGTYSGGGGPGGGGGGGGWPW